jgi:hypothetical protein
MIIFNLKEVPKFTRPTRLLSDSSPVKEENEKQQTINQKEGRR